MANYFEDPMKSFVPTPMYKPNFSAIQIALATKQSQYDQGLAGVQSMYGSIFNADVTNDQLKEKKKQFLADADYKLTRLAKSDLSLVDNQKLAAGVFSSFYDDPNIINDISTTSYLKDQLKIGLEMQKSTDPKVRDGYWDQSVYDLNSRLGELQKGDPNDPLIYQKLNYVANRDRVAEALKAYKDFGAKFESVSGTGGPMILTTTNGYQSRKPIQNFVEMLLGNKYDDMYAVMGRNELRQRVQFQKDKFPGISGEEAKSKAAALFIADKEGGIRKTIEGTTGLIDAVNARQNQLLDPKDKTKAVSEGAAKEYLENKNTLLQLEDQQKSLQSTQQFLQSGKEDYNKIYDNILHGGEEYFARIFKQRDADNISVGIAGMVQQKVDKNDAYFAEKTLDNDNERLKQTIRMNDWSIDKDQWEMKYGKLGGNPKDNTHDKNPTDLPDPNERLDYTMKGANTTNPENLTDAYTLQTFNTEQSSYLNNGMGIQIDALAAFLPGLGLGISPSDATSWAAKMKSNYSNSPKVSSSKESEDVDAKLIKYIKDQKISIQPGCPTCFVNTIKTLVASSMERRAEGPEPLTNQEIQYLKYDIPKGEEMVNTYKKRQEIYQTQQKKFMGDKYDKLPAKDKAFLEKTGDGFRMIDGEKIQNAFIPLYEFYQKIANSNMDEATWDNMSSTVGDPFVWELRSSGPHFVGFAAYKAGVVAAQKKLKNLTPKKLAEDYLNGALFQDIGGSNAFALPLSNYLADIRAKVGNPEAAYNLIHSVDQNAVRSLSKDINTGQIGMSMNFTVRGPSVKEPNGSDGNLLVNEVFNPGNNKYPETSKNSEDITLFSEAGTYLSGNADAIGSVDYNPSSRIATVYANQSKLSDLTKDNPKLREYLRSPISIPLSDVASGTIIDELPSPSNFQIHEKVLNGEKITATPVQKQFGFDYELYANNYGHTGLPAKNMVLNLHIYKWGPVQNPDGSWKRNGEAISMWNPSTVPGEWIDNMSIPLEGKLPDAMMKKIQELWQMQLDDVNGRKKQFQQNVQTSPTSPPPQDLSIKHLEEMFQSQNQ